MADFTFPPVAGQMWPRGGVIVASGIGDTFNRADTTGGLGTTSDGAATWTIVSGTAWRITSNQAAVGANAVSVAALQLNRTAQTARATFRAGTASGPAVRIADANNYIRVTTTSSTWRVQKVVGGTPAEIITTALAPTAGDLLELSIDSNNLVTFKLNSISRGTATVADSVLSTPTRVGLHGSVSGTLWDDFQTF